MKRKLIYLASVLVITFSFTACELIDDCQTCRYESYDSSTGTTEYMDEADYCGQELIDMKATAPWTYGTVTTKVRCY
jgi:hypothetical protein